MQKCNLTAEQIKRGLDLFGAQNITNKQRSAWNEWLREHGSDLFADALLCQDRSREISEIRPAFWRLTQLCARLLRDPGLAYRERGDCLRTLRECSCDGPCAIKASGNACGSTPPGPTDCAVHWGELGKVPTIQAGAGVGLTSKEVTCAG